MTPTRPHDRAFVIFWLDVGPAERTDNDSTTTPSPKVVGREIIHRHDMSDALTTAGHRLKRHPHAYGFAVSPLNEKTS